VIEKGRYECDRGLVAHPKDFQGCGTGVLGRHGGTQRSLLGALTLKLCGIAKCRPRRHTAGVASLGDAAVGIETSSEAEFAGSRL
jgi:hypothetical protein